MESNTQPPSQENRKVIYFLMIIIVVLISAIIVGGGVYWWQKSVAEGEKNKTIEQVRQELEKKVIEPQSQLKQLQKQKELETIPAGWKIFEGEVYSISYPNDWRFGGPEFSSEIPQEDATAKTDIILSSPSDYTTLSVNLGYPAGWAGGGYKFEDVPITVMVGGIQYTVGEVRLFRQVNFTSFDDPNPPEPIYEDAPTSLRWFWLKAEKHTYKGHPFYILFGNDYPAFTRSSNKPDALDVYEKEKTVALEILKTFRLKTQN